MLQLMKKSDTAIIVLHEIYGVNEHMKNFCQSLFEYEFDVFCPNLLGTETVFDYSQEETAYQYFVEKIGFDKASSTIRNLISDMKDNYKELFIIGFSVGATTAWLCSEEESIQAIVGYYGSRIRNYINITPKCPTLLFFPEKEKSFNVDALMTSLETMNAESQKFNGNHGFSDPYSANYNKGSAQETFNLMIDFISNHSTN